MMNYKNECLCLDIDLVHEFYKENYNDTLMSYKYHDSFPKGSKAKTNTDCSSLNFIVSIPDNIGITCRSLGCGDLNEYIIWLENKLKEKDKKKRI